MSSPPLPGFAGHPEQDSKVGVVLADRYRLDALLGEGGMGSVYAAEHIMMRKRLAVKVLRRELSSVPEVLARFEREAMAAANISHPNVAAATDFGKLPDGTFFLALEFVEGRSLRDLIEAGPIPSERAVRIARQVASALESAHELGIVHRDLKPENVMLMAKRAEPDFVKVLDFGIAKVPSPAQREGTRGALTRTGMVFGTPEYMAPEQALGQSVDGRTDLYALGVVVYEMLAGVRPFFSDSQSKILGQQLSSQPPRIAERAPGVHVPAQLESLVLRLLEKNLNQRLASATELLRALDALDFVSPASRSLTLHQGSGLGAVDASRESAAETEYSASGPAELPVKADFPVSSSRLRVASNTESQTHGRLDDMSVGRSAATAEGSVRSAPLDPSGSYEVRTRSNAAQGLSTARQRAQQALMRTATWVDGHRSDLPRWIRRPLRNLSAEFLIGAAAVSVVLVFAIVMILAIVAFTGSAKTDPASSSQQTASATQPELLRFR